MSQDSYHLPWGAVSVCPGTDPGAGTEYEKEKGKITDLPVCGYSGTKTGDSERGCGADFGSSCTTQGKTRKSHSDTLAVHIRRIEQLDCDAHFIVSLHTLRTVNEMTRTQDNTTYSSFLPFRCLCIQPQKGLKSRCFRPCNTAESDRSRTHRADR